MKNIWTKAIREEIISMLSLIVSGVMLLSGFKLLGFIFLVKGCIETFYSIYLSFKEIKSDN